MYIWPAIKDTQLGSHCSGTCLSLFQCCGVMVFRWNCPILRQGKGRRPTQVLMSRIVACLLQGNVRIVIVIFLEKIIVFSKYWVWIFKNAGFSKHETQTSRLDSRVLKFEFSRVSSRDFRGWSRDFQFSFERFCNFPFSAFPVLSPALEWTKMEAACRAGHLQVPIPIGAGVLD